jgi:hypothetical protein
VFLGVGYQFESFFPRDPVLLGLIVGLSHIGVIALRNSRLIVLTAGFLVLYTAFYLWLNIPSYHWYFGVHYLFGTIYAVLGLQALRDVIGTYARKRIAVSIAMLTGALMLGKQASFAHAAISSAGSYAQYKEIGLWLKEHTREDATIACVEIGHIGWYSRRYIIDILGLVNPHNAKFIGEQKLDEWLKHYQPDFILVHNPRWPHEASAKKVLEDGTFVPVPHFTFEGYALIQRWNR